MKLKTSQLEELTSDEFTLVGLYSSYENYRLAFFLNDLLNWGFERTLIDLDIQIKDSFVHFPIFRSRSYENEINIYLINNCISIKELCKENDNTLFNSSFEKTIVHRLLPELKDIDYLIKIEDGHYSLSAEKVTRKINRSDLDANAMIIPNKQIKSKGHLIID